MDELVREALREGRLTVAGGGPAALYTPWAAGFEKQYPGITVQVQGAFSNQLVAGIDRQLESGAPAVDVAILQTLQDFARWKAAGALLKVDIPAMEQLDPDWRDDDGRYLPIGVFGLGYGYDPRQVAGEQVPRSAAGFTDPRWHGRVVSTYPHQDDVTLYLYTALAERHGWDRFAALSRDRTRCPRCPASRGTTRCRHRQAVVARVPRRAGPAVRIRPRAQPGALHPRARCRPARQDAPGS
jgi:hypothetical protein